MKRNYIDIAYEDHDLIIVNKPRGILVLGEPNSSSLTGNVRSYLMRKYEGAKGAFARPLHRLDKETTGLVLFAKSNVGLKLTKDIKEHQVRRVYKAIVEGSVKDEGGTVKLPLEKGDFGHGKKVGVAKSGKPAITHYRVLERYDTATLVEVRLETGFTHQIRVHMAAINHPIIGDKVYNSHSAVKFPRQALHATEVVFHHPATGKKIKVEAAMPADMLGLLDELRDRQ